MAFCNDTTEEKILAKYSTHEEPCLRVSVLKLVCVKERGSEKLILLAKDTHVQTERQRDGQTAQKFLLSCFLIQVPDVCASSLFQMTVGKGTCRYIIECICENVYTNTAQIQTVRLLAST